MIPTSILHSITHVLESNNDDADDDADEGNGSQVAAIDHFFASERGKRKSLDS